MPRDYHEPDEPISKLSPRLITDLYAFEIREQAGLVETLDVPNAVAASYKKLCHESAEKLLEASRLLSPYLKMKQPKLSRLRYVRLLKKTFDSLYAQVICPALVGAGLFGVCFLLFYPLKALALKYIELFGG